MRVIARLTFFGKLVMVFLITLVLSLVYSVKEAMTKKQEQVKTTPDVNTPVVISSTPTVVIPSQ